MTDTTSMASEDLVLSIPAGTSLHLIEELNVYACPASYRRYDRAAWITFRAEGGVMRRIWRIGRVCEVDLNSADSLARLSERARNQVTGYLNGYATVGSVYQGTHRFTFLDEVRQIPLAHSPQADVAAPRAKYYLRLSDLRNPSQTLVPLASHRQR